MEPGILIDGIHTFDAYGLIMTSYQMEPPPVKTKYVDLPIGNGTIDMTEAIFGDVSYEDRQAEFNFVYLGAVNNRADLLSQFGAFVHGRRRRITTADDPYHYYVGRLAISDTERDKAIQHIQVTATCEPYKYKMFPTVVSGAVPAGGAVTRSCLNSRMRVIPEITVSTAATISFGGSTYSVNAGTWKLTNVVFVEGDNEITITAAAGTTYSITYQEGLI